MWFWTFITHWIVKTKLSLLISTTAIAPFFSVVYFLFHYFESILVGIVGIYKHLVVRIVDLKFENQNLLMVQDVLYSLISPGQLWWPSEMFWQYFWNLCIFVNFIEHGMISLYPFPFSFWLSVMKTFDGLGIFLLMISWCIEFVFNDSWHEIELLFTLFCNVLFETSKLSVNSLTPAFWLFFIIRW